jgi:hypothetical protein
MDDPSFYGFPVWPDTALKAAPAVRDRRAADQLDRDCGAGPSWVWVLLKALANAGAAFDPAAALAARRWARIRDEELGAGRR